ncbi:MAG: M23 family metallopeptidase [Actinobacteria bacterium]|nr:M23 family metallopeptidase [Actinomycetota bacterium]
MTTGLETSLSRDSFFVPSRHGVTLRYRVRSATSTVYLTIRLVLRHGQTTIRTWHRKVRDGQWHTVHWSGMPHGQMEPDGNYAFRVAAARSDGTVVRAAGGTAHNRFTMHNFAFPVRGPHNFGTDVNRFGAPRNGHTHQGQDVLADCGLPIVAARGGVVKANAFQAGGAGNYLVVSGAGTGWDFVYAHLLQPSRHQVGDTVYTGQQIGVVGQTGDATACHLHFEMWSSPGWYSGGQPFDPLPYLETWESYS